MPIMPLRLPARDVAGDDSPRSAMMNSTPLMAVTNAISSVIVVGALIAVAVPVLDSASWTSKGLGFGALVLASVNIFGGFLVTARMLAMYKKKEK
jgi:NAD(P) transhydrogenase subunit alpha